MPAEEAKRYRVVENGLIHKISLPLPFPQVHQVNVYLVGRKHFILIDTGIRSEESYDLLLSYLKSNNITHLDAIYLTHGHVDHFGAAARLRKQGIVEKIFIHEREISNISNEYNEVIYTVYLKQYGIPSDIIEMMKYASVFFDNFADRLDNLSFIKPGDIVEYDGGAFEVIHTPGHTSGSICFYDKQKGFMLSGDTLLSRLSPNPLLDLAVDGGRRKSLIEYISSLELLYNMGIKTVYPGHYETIHDHRALIKNLLTFHYKRMMKIHNIIKQTPMTPYEITEKLFRKLNQMDIFLAASEVIGHLDLLEQHDMVSSFEKNGLLYYKAI
ncbi:MAG: MBL fold metallo-hydrolase [bacterium]